MKRYAAFNGVTVAAGPDKSMIPLSMQYVYDTGEVYQKIPAALSNEYAQAIRGSKVMWVSGVCASDTLKVSINYPEEYCQPSEKWSVADEVRRELGRGELSG